MNWRGQPIEHSDPRLVRQTAGHWLYCCYALIPEGRIWGKGETAEEALSDLQVHLDRTAAWLDDDGFDEWMLLPLDPPET